MRTRVKICGITRERDAMCAVEHGADALGFVFYEPSPRFISAEKAGEIVRRLPPFVTSVALFVDARPDHIARVVDQVGVDLLQFHGTETPASCAGHGRPWIRAVAMKPALDPLVEHARFAAARGLLLDAYIPGVPGGTGACFDWERIPRELAPNIILAGGLNPTNVAEAVQRVRPYAVDVSGGVEAAKGIKDPEKIRLFIQEVRRAGQ